MKPLCGKIPFSPRRAVRAASIASLFILPTAGSAWADDAPAAADKVLSTVTVTGTTETDTQAAQKKLARIAGGTSVVDSAQAEKGRAASNADLLSYQPGVYAQAGAGSSGSQKVSIRGSGINGGVGTFRTGIYTLFDGLPLTGASGTPFELFEPLGLSHTEIYRGANAFDLGNTELAGAINYVSHTGYDSSPLELHYELGSHGYEKEQISSGQVIGPMDYYFSVVNLQNDGFQDHTKGTSTGFSGNIGFQITPQISTRFYLRYKTANDEVPGYDTLAEAYSKRGASNPLYTAQNYQRRAPGTTWLGNKTTIDLDNGGRVEIGAVYHDFPIDEDAGVYHDSWWFHEASESINWIQPATWFGLKTVSTVGLTTTQTLDAGLKYQVRIPSGTTAALAKGTTLTKDHLDGTNSVFHASEDIELFQNFWVTPGLSAAYTTRSEKQTDPTRSNYDNDSLQWLPRIGVRYDLTPELQLYGNISRSSETVPTWKYLFSGPSYTTGPATGLPSSFRDLHDQTATTYEIGGRGNFGGNNKWSLSYYYSDVRNEILTVQVQDATATTTALTSAVNGSPTRHQGIEAGLESQLWESPAHDKLTYRQAYTFSDFRYKDDATFGSDQLPGIPRNFYQGQLTYDWHNGVYVSANTQMSSRMAIDYANSIYTRPYALLGATLGYSQPEGHWDVYLDLKNLTDRRYVSTINTAYNDAGVDQRRSVPGEPFGAYAGITYRY